MALVINVAYTNKSESKSYIYKDASFKTIGNVLPTYVEISTDLIETDNKTGKRYFSFKDVPYSDQKLPKKIFTDVGRRYEIFPYEVIGSAIYLERIINDEKKWFEEENEDKTYELGSRTWKVQYGGLVNSIDNSIYDREAIKNSIKNIFTFSLRERIILPEFGSCLDEVIGSSITDGQSVVIREMVEKMMGWEPRINLQNVTLSQNPDEYEISIGIVYGIPSLKISQESLEMLIKVTDD